MQLLGQSFDGFEDALPAAPSSQIPLLRQMDVNVLFPTTNERQVPLPQPAGRSSVQIDPTHVPEVNSASPRTAWSTANGRPLRQPRDAIDTLDGGVCIFYRQRSRSDVLNANPHHRLLSFPRTTTWTLLLKLIPEIGATLALIVWAILEALVLSTSSLKLSKFCRVPISANQPFCIRVMIRQIGPWGMSSGPRHLSPRAALMIDLVLHQLLQQL